MKKIILFLVPLIILQGCLALLAVDKNIKKSIILVDAPTNTIISADGVPLAIQSTTASGYGKKHLNGKIELITSFYQEVKVEKNKNIILELKSGSKKSTVTIDAKSGERYSYFLDVPAAFENKTPRTQKELKDKIRLKNKVELVVP